MAIGTGHVMRCLTLADALRRRGAATRFLTRAVPPHLRAIVAEHGHEVVELEANPAEPPAGDLAHAAWLRTNQAADARETRHALADDRWDWVVVDHYAIDARWEGALRGTAARVLVIDDLADRRHDCDVLLDQNFYVNMDTRYLDRVPPGARSLLGPRYALLRDEFRRARAHGAPRAGRIGRALIAFGGVDADNDTGTSIAALAASGIAGVRADVIVGAQHPRLAAVQAACAAHGFDCHVQTSRVAELMAGADLGIGAAGSESWERCCMALPSIAVATAANQQSILDGLEALGVVVSIRTRPLEAGSLTRALHALHGDPDRLRAMSRAASAVVDGEGAERVCEALLAAA